MMSEEPERYAKVLTPMRGIAALAIVFFHGAVSFGVSTPLVVRVDLLKIAVTFFFVLSGFVLTLSWRPESAASFWLRRAARLLPLYLLAWLATLAGRSWLHWESSQLDLATTLLLVQAWWPNDQLAMAVNPPAWSLSCEALFYITLPLLASRALSLSAPARRRATTAVAVWLLLAVCLSGFAPIEWWAGYRGAEFAIGVLLAAHVRAGWRPSTHLRWAAVASCLSVLVLILTGASVSGPFANLCAAPGFAFVIAVAATTNKQHGWLDNATTQALGRWSYALYISHWIIVILISRFLVSSAWIPVAAVVCVLAAAGLHRFVEVPAERRILLSIRNRTSTGQSLASDQAVPHLL